jgi:hypothetical protein
MRRFFTYGVVAMLVVLAGCADPAAPRDDGRKWEWPDGLATGSPFGDPVLFCNPTTVAFNGTVSCTLANAVPTNNPTWHFESEGGQAVSGPAYTGQWSGNMVITGDVVVNYTMSSGSPGQLRETVSVTRRTTGWSWASSVGGREATAGEVDACFSTNPHQLGLTPSKDCANPEFAIDLFIPVEPSDNNGFVAASIPAGTSNGPNQGLWYVSTATADMDLRAQVRKRIRADGDTLNITGHDSTSAGCATAFPSAPTLGRNVRTVNKVCLPTASYDNTFACVRSHELLHVDRATASAQQSANDVYKLWEPVVATSANSLRIALSNLYVGANDRVFDYSEDLHSTLTNTPYAFWDNIGFGWSKSLRFTGCP